jgi:hypothetical protein
VDLHPVKPPDGSIRHKEQKIDFVISIGDGKL